MKDSSENVTTWRKNLKRRALQLFNNKCACCNYDKCAAALEFHHLEPEHKDFSISKAYSEPKAWDIIVKELEKCVLVCANCHREIHYGDRTIENKTYINYNYVDYRLYETDNYHKCFCGTVIHKKFNYCSTECYNNNRRKIDWDKEKNNLLTLIDKDRKSYVTVSKLYGVSDKTIRKWYLKFSE